MWTGGRHRGLTFLGAKGRMLLVHDNGHCLGALSVDVGSVTSGKV